MKIENRTTTYILKPTFKQDILIILILLSSTIMIGVIYYHYQNIEVQKFAKEIFKFDLSRKTYLYIFIFSIIGDILALYQVLVRTINKININNDNIILYNFFGEKENISNGKFQIIRNNNNLPSEVVILKTDTKEYRIREIAFRNKIEYQDFLSKISERQD